MGVLASPADQAVSGHHEMEIAGTVSVPDLCQGEHRVRISYEPNLDEEILFVPEFVALSNVERVLANNIGTLKVFMDDLQRPILATALDLSAAIRLHSGRANVGFTAATSDLHWQKHEILDWSFTSSRQTKTL